MARYGPQLGPDITFLGVARCDWADPATFPGADVVILGAPFDGALARQRLDAGRRDHLGSRPAAAGWPVTWRPAGSAAPGRVTEGDG